MRIIERKTIAETRSAEAEKTLRAGKKSESAKEPVSHKGAAILASRMKIFGR